MKRFPLLRWTSFIAAALLTAFVVALSATAENPPPAPPARTAPAPPIIERIFFGERKGDWQDYGWAPRDTSPGGPERLNVSSYGGWILVNPSLRGRYGGLSLHLKHAGELQNALELRVDSAKADIFPRVIIGPAHQRALSNGWTEVFVPMHELNPKQAPFDRIVLRARRALPRDTFIEIDHLGLTAEQPDAPRPTTPARITAAHLSVDCAATPTPISPLIYGIAFSPLRELQSDHQWKLGATARRWGGNPASRFNWELGNAWNTTADYFFRNVNYTQRPSFTWETFLQTNASHAVKTALTVPTIGWVARDTTSFSFPVSTFGAQQQTDPDHPQAGNGVSASGIELTAGTPNRTSVPAPPEFVERWVKTIRTRETKGARSVDMYILDNEPALWHVTQRDVHPAPVSYDELLDKTLAYGTAVRRADPHAVIAGPAEWGWPGYMWSAVDAKAGFRRRPDRRAHGDVELIAWYLREVAAYEKRTSIRVLDVLDLHFYPQGRNIGVGDDGATDPDTSARRIRSTRALWDPTYVDESWIAEPIELIPRMQRWVDQNNPGLKLSLGEYSFGAERHPSGALALAEALGRFGKHGLYSAFYWTYPAEGSPAFWAFRAFRNYDARGAHFLDWSLPTTAAPDTSLFAARNAEGTKLTLVALNFSATETYDARLTLKSCGEVTSQRIFTWSGDPRGFVQTSAATTTEYRMEPWSITVIELAVATPSTVPREKAPH